MTEGVRGEGRGARVYNIKNFDISTTAQCPHFREKTAIISVN